MLSGFIWAASCSPHPQPMKPIQNCSPFLYYSRQLPFGIGSERRAGNFLPLGSTTSLPWYTMLLAAATAAAPDSSSFPSSRHRQPPVRCCRVVSWLEEEPAAQPFCRGPYARVAVRATSTVTVTLGAAIMGTHAGAAAVAIAGMNVCCGCSTFLVQWLN